jgi:subtilase family serine protease
MSWGRRRTDTHNELERARSMILFRNASRIPGRLRVFRLVAVIVLPCAVAGAATVGNSGDPLISSAVDETQRITLSGHVHPMARAALDAGEVSSSLAMSELQLIFKRSETQQRNLQKLLTDQQDRTSPRYRKWLTPTQFGARFGAGGHDIAIASAWLKSQGFTVGAVPSGRGYLPFAGTAGQVETAFQTKIHSFNLDSEQHYAAVANPTIPAAFQNLVVAVAGLHDFHPRPTVRSGRDLSPARPAYDDGNGNFYVLPADVATIYGFNPAYAAGIKGAGIAIAVAAQSDIQSALAMQYWTSVGVNQSQQITSMAVPRSAGGNDPGQTNDGNETEAYLDVEIIGGLAPAAQILLVRDTSASSAAAYAIDQNLAPVLNISFAECEYQLGTAGNAQVQTTYQQAAAQGITVIVASGDAGIAQCDADVAATPAQGDTVLTGLSISGLTSTPYNLSVGGTDFNVLLAQNWATSNAPGTLSSAQSYIPEAVWNFSCANPIYVQALSQASALALCNSQLAVTDELDVIEGGGGGISGCSTLATSGDCQSGYPQPSWQSGVAGIESYGARAIPDVSMLANLWVVCDQTVATCAPSGDQGFIALAGTSAAAPTMAAVVGLLNQSLGGDTNARQGNIGPLLYSLASVEYGSTQSPNTSSLSSCNASNGQNIGANCLFNDITAGSDAQPCSVANYTGAPTGSTPIATCVSSSGGTYGIVELSGTPAYAAGSGYDLATGLGSVNTNNLLVAALGLQVPPQGLKAAVSGTGVTLTWTADQYATSYNLYQASTSGAEGTTPVLSNAPGTSATIGGLQNAQSYFFTIAGVTAYGVSAQSNEVSVTLPPAAPTGVTATGTATAVQLTWSASTGATSYNVYQGSQAGGESATPIASALPTTSYMVSGSAGQHFYFKVAAVGPGGVSALSGEASASVLVPAAPSHGGGSMSWVDVALGSLICAVQLWRRRRGSTVPA